MLGQYRKIDTTDFDFMSEFIAVLSSFVGINSIGVRFHQIIHCRTFAMLQGV
jgi:hypothetical protein